MATLLVQHDVADYDAWRGVYDEVQTLRDEFGCTSARVWNLSGGPNTVLVLHEFPTMLDAQSFADSPALKEAMRRSGVTSAPRIELWEDTNG